MTTRPSSSARSRWPRASRAARKTPHTSVWSAPSMATVLWAAVERSNGPLGAGLVGRRAGVDDHPPPADGQLEAEAVGLGVGGKVGWARVAHVGHQVEPLVGADDDVARGPEHREPLTGRRPGAERRQPGGPTRVQSLKRGTSPSGISMRPSQVRMRVDGAGEPGDRPADRRRPAGRRRR